MPAIIGKVKKVVTLCLVCAIVYMTIEIVKLKTQSFFYPNRPISTDKRQSNFMSLVSVDQRNQSSRGSPLSVDHRKPSLKLPRGPPIYGNDQNQSSSSLESVDGRKPRAWRAVSDDRQSFVFSAYLVKGAGVRLIGATLDTTLDHQCQLSYTVGDTTDVSTVPATVTGLGEAHSKPYEVSSFLCGIALGKDKSNEPDTVCLVLADEPCRSPLPVIPVPVPPVEAIYTYSICVGPVYKPYGKEYQLVQWLELNLLLGVEHVTVYVQSTHDNVRNVLAYYKMRGLVEIVEWDIPFAVDLAQRNMPKKSTEIWAFGQLAAINDCLFRYKGISEYVAMIDLDEYIIPRRKADYTWKDMFRHLSTRSGGYSFANTFFRPEWPDNEAGSSDERAETFNLEVLLVTARESFQHQTPAKGKYIVRPTATTKVNIHRAPAGEKVEQDVALVHHYRDLRDYRGSGVTSDRIVSDTTMQKYESQLIANVEKAWSDLNQVP